MEYRLAKSNRGDPLGPQQDSELGVVLPDSEVEPQEDESVDVTISYIADILTESPPQEPKNEDQLEISSPHSPTLSGDQPTRLSQVI